MKYKLKKNFKNRAKVFRNLAKIHKELYEKEDRVFKKYKPLYGKREHTGDLFQSWVCEELAKICDDLAKLR